MRIDPQGRRRETWLCDGIRVEPPLLKRLTCAEDDRPQARAARQEWRDVLRHRALATAMAAAPARSARSARSTPCSGETSPAVLRSGALEVEARPARFPVFVDCPNGAHPPQAMTMDGLDVFEGGEFVIGGLHAGRTGGGPRVVNPAQVQSLLDHSRDLALQVLGRAANGAGS